MYVVLVCCLLVLDDLDVSFNAFYFLFEKLRRISFFKGWQNHPHYRISINKQSYLLMETLASTKTRWPSGLRRNVKAVVFIGVGSNPTRVITFALSLGNKK